MVTLFISISGITVHKFMLFNKIANKLDNFLLLNSVSSKRRLFEAVSEKASLFCDHKSKEILDFLLQRERLGSTSVGNGVAIPHFSLADISDIFAIVALIKEPVEYDTIDDQPVDVAIFLIAPDNQPAENLRALSCISLAVKKGTFLEGLRMAQTEEDMYAFVTKYFSEKAA